MRQYAIGTLALSTATQAGLASTLSALAGVRASGSTGSLEHPPRLSAVERRRRERGGRRVLRAGPASRRSSSATRRPSPAPLAALGPVTRMHERSAVDRRWRTGRSCPAPRSTGWPHRRTDERWLADAWSRARVVAITPKSATATDRGRAIDRLAGRLPTSPPDAPRRFLGVADDVPYFAATIERDDAARGRRCASSGRTPTICDAGLFAAADRPGAVAPAAHALPAVRHADRRVAGRLDADAARPTAATTSRAPIPR